MAEHHEFAHSQERGIFAQIMAALVAEHGEAKTVMSDATYLKLHRRATSIGIKRGICLCAPLVRAKWRMRSDRSDQGGMNIKLHVVCDRDGRLSSFFAIAGPVRDYIGARALMHSLSNLDRLLGDRGYDADWYREALKGKRIRACIPGRKQRTTPMKYDKLSYKRHNCIDIMSGRLKDWRPVAKGYDRCPKVFLSAIALAAPLSYWL